MDQNDAPAQSAHVKDQLQTVNTDEYGYFEIRNEQAEKTAAVSVSVSVAGYFPGIRTSIVEHNKAALVRIKLIRRTTSGSFFERAGGSVTLTRELRSPCLHVPWYCHNGQSLYRN